MSERFVALTADLDGDIFAVDSTGGLWVGRVAKAAHDVRVVWSLVHSEFASTNRSTKEMTHV
jgi:hypothetical protein